MNHLYAKKASNPQSEAITPIEYNEGWFEARHPTLGLIRYKSYKEVHEALNAPILNSMQSSTNRSSKGSDEAVDQEKASSKYHDLVWID